MLHPRYDVFILELHYISEIISVHTKVPEKTHHITIHVHWACTCHRKQEADSLPENTMGKNAEEEQQ